MDVKFAKYMKWGKLVEQEGLVYKLVENMTDETGFVKAVNMENFSRYELLGAWIQNWKDNSMGFRERFTENIEDCKTERERYVELLEIADIEPYNTVRFITPNYKTKFTVKDLDTVSVKGIEARVAFLDECHFTFVDKIAMNLYGGCFHICQFAEICEEEGIEVKPIEHEERYEQIASLNTICDR